MSRLSSKRPECSELRLPASSARTLKKKPDDTTPSWARIEPTLLELAPFGITTITRPLPLPANGWNSDTRNHTSATAADGPARRRSRSWRSRSRSSAVRSCSDCDRLPRDKNWTLVRLRRQPALEQVRRRARVLAGRGGTVEPLGDARRKTLVVHVH